MNRHPGTVLARSAMRSSPSFTVLLPLGGVDLGPGIAETALPLPHVPGSPGLGVLSGGPTPPGAFAVLRLGLSGWAYAFLRRREVSRVPLRVAFGRATVLDPAEISSALAICERLLLPSGSKDTVGSRSLNVTGLNPLALAGCGPILALPTLRP